MRRIYTVILFVVMASIDNTVLALLPALTTRIGAELNVASQDLGLAIGLNRLVLALTAVFWGYRSDQSDRRRLMILGTLTWVVPVGLIVLAQSYTQLLLLMLAAGLGLGCISTVGYSVITDIVAPGWRGVLLGLWGLAQGIGALGGGLLIGLLPVSAAWSTPFGVMAAVGGVCSIAALFTVAPRKGGAEAALQNLADQGIDYDYRIQFADLPLILAKSSNRWLMLQGFLAQFAFGALSLLPALLAARMLTQGLDGARATGVAALLIVVLQLGGVISIAWGWLGDRLQARYPRARALLAAYGFWLALPCYIALFWLPLPLMGRLDGSASEILGQQLGGNPWFWLALLASTLATVFQATNAPNWFAMVSEVNLPEHRGTAFSFINLANNIGAAIGVILVTRIFDWLQRSIPTPDNYAIGLTLFQLFFLPAGLCFWLAARSTPHDVAQMQATLRDRAAQSIVSPHADQATAAPS
ncbi:MAG: MFS transporter [Chloroflexi bacterium]|nr:MFS transporter [Chloroflexota bacterium]